MNTSNHVVVLLHGLGQDKTIMSTLESALIDAGFTVYNHGYISTKHAIHEIALNVAKAINNRYAGYHIALVGHSMGGIIIRAMLAEKMITNVDRVVMLGTPNQGSEVATFLKKFKWYQNAFGQPGLELSTDEQGIHHQLPEDIAVHCGIIAGTLSMEPWISWTIPGRNDGKVSIESTRLKGSKHHITVPVTHGRLPRSKRVIQKVIQFLHEGHFN